MTIRDLRARARRLGAGRDLTAVQASADDQASRDHALARLLHIAGEGPAPADLPADVSARLARRRAPFTASDREALLARLRRLIGDVRKGPLP